MAKRVLIAGAQMDPKINEKEYNLARAVDFCKKASKKGAKVVIFPECTLTGYCFSSRQEAFSMSETIPGPSTKCIEEICKELDLSVLMGIIERAGDKCYNSSALIGPEGIIGKYRKIHLPFVGLDRFVDEGDIPFSVYDTEFGRFGWVICYDAGFPESVRVLTLKGAEIVAQIANWPEAAENNPRYVVPTRAYENHINYIGVDRVGEERGVKFIGMSKIVDYLGNTLVEASADKEEIICAEVDLEKASDKRTIVVPGEFEQDRIKDRRPEFYRSIVDDIDN